MKRDAAITRLRSLEPALRRQGVSALFLFGSVARNDASDTSDLDLLFDVPRNVRFSLFDQARIQRELAELLCADVDFVPMEALRPGVRSRVEAEMVRVF